VESGKTSPKPALGFLTVVDHPQHGLCGGYLVLNLAGRPLEFHCTAPIKPNRAQQILYGPTLESFLYGEQIGFTLLGHAKSRPMVVCTDREPVLSLRDLVDVPVALVLPPDDVPAADPGGSPSADRVVVRVDTPHAHSPRMLTFEFGRNRLALTQPKADDRRRLCEQLGEAAADLDLWEPFTRIREAIEEAQQAAR
jgi:hypothetical protein